MFYNYFAIFLMAAVYSVDIPDSHRWIVEIQKERDGTSCSGALLSYNTLVTTASCIVGDDVSITIHGRESNVDVKLFILAVYPHPLFKGATHRLSEFDIAVWKYRIFPGYEVPRITFPRLDDSSIERISYSKQNLVGYFQTKDLSNEIRESQVMILQRSLCIRHYPQMGVGTFCVDIQKENCHINGPGAFIVSSDNMLLGVGSGVLCSGSTLLFQSLSSVVSFIEHPNRFANPSNVAQGFIMPLGPSQGRHPIQVIKSFK